MFLMVVLMVVIARQPEAMEPVRQGMAPFRPSHSHSPASLVGFSCGELQRLEQPKKRLSRTVMGKKDQVQEPRIGACADGGLA